jgi:hypothetical protein
MFGFHWQEDTRIIYSINALSFLQAFVAICAANFKMPSKMPVRMTVSLHVWLPLARRYKKNLLY